MTNAAKTANVSTTTADEPFVVLPENELAVAGIDQLLEDATQGDSGEENQPNTVRLVYLHGPAGVGKSQLVARLLAGETDSIRSDSIRHSRASELIARVDQAHSRARLSELREEYCQLDLFICEDFTAIERKPETQRLIIMAIDETLARGGRVLITSSKSPGELENVASRLVNRLHAGACLAVAMPAQESRRRLLLHFAQLRRVEITEEAAQYLAASLLVSPRELRAAVGRLSEMAVRSGSSRIDQTSAEDFVQQCTAPPPPTPAEITRAVAKQFGVSVKALRTGGRTATTALPRQVAMSLCRELTRQSLERIATYYGRQNHGTVIHARKRIAARLQDDPALRRNVREIRRRLGINVSDACRTD